ncbi:MAG: redoxin domain-containing protein [Acidobacteriota bacterium]|nr:redoxin domain-containing protein [Acidobacteriota bacterium]
MREILSVPRDPLLRLCLLALTLGGLPLVGLPAHGQAAQGGSTVQETVARYGLRPIDPAAPASQFTLPDLAGGETSLEDFRGRWVLLTFWATWCGPCRSEMPSLQRLHEAREDQGLSVVGVSIDDQRRPVDPFVQSMGLTFPNLWDGEGRVAQAYRAGSIPLSYLVDPQGRLVAVSRGARDWSELTPMIDAVLASETGDDPTYVAQDEPLQLPEVLNPPSADLRLSEERVAAGEPFELEVRLRWSGNFEEYLPHPPQVALPEGVEQEAMTASTSTQDGRNVVTYRLTLRAAETGRYALDPVELRYTPRYEAEPVTSRLSGPTVEVVTPDLAGMAPSTVAWVAGGTALTGLLAFFAFRWLRRRPAAGGTVEVDPRLRALEGRLDEARAARLRGEGAEAARLLAQLELELGVETSECRHLQSIVEQARYGGQAPPAPELDGMQRRVERRLAELRPDPEQAQRKALRLRRSDASASAAKTLSEERR